MSGSVAACRVGYLGQQVVITRRNRAATIALWRLLLPPLVLFCALIAQLSVRLGVIEVGYRVEQLRIAALAKDAQLRERRLEYAYVTRPDLLAARAKEDLQLIPMPPSAVRQIVGTRNVLAAERNP